MIVSLCLIFKFLVLISIDQCTDGCPVVLSFMEKDKKKTR